jgi:hypothetical protein
MGRRNRKTGARERQQKMKDTKKKEIEDNKTEVCFFH